MQKMSKKAKAQANKYPTFTISDTKKSNDWLKSLPCQISRNGKVVALAVKPKDIRWIDNIVEHKTYVSHGKETHELGDDCLTCDKITRQFEEAKESEEIAELLEKGPEIYDDPNYVPPRDGVKKVTPEEMTLVQNGVKGLDKEQVDKEASKMVGEKDVDTLEQSLDPNTKFIVHGEDRHPETVSCEICDKAVLGAKIKAEEEALSKSPESSKHESATDAQTEALRLANENKGKMTGVVERNVPQPTGPPVHGYKSVADIERFTNEQAKRNQQSRKTPTPPRKADYVDLEMI